MYYKRHTPKRSRFRNEILPILIIMILILILALGVNLILESQFGENLKVMQEEKEYCLQFGDFHRDEVPIRCLKYYE